MGTYQDSFLVETVDYSIDMHYFPHFQNVEFYGEFRKDDCPWYIENAGNTDMYFRTSVGVIKLERKLVCKENAEEYVPLLTKGDLYPPAGVGEFGV